MTDRELLQQALDVLLQSETDPYAQFELSELENKAIEAIKARLAQPEPEPVAWMNEDVLRIDNIIKAPIQVCRRKQDEHYNIPLYTSPTKKKWVCMTDDEVRFIVRGNTDVWCENPETDPYGVAEMVEAKLKEKNNG